LDVQCRPTFLLAVNVLSLDVNDFSTLNIMRSFSDADDKAMCNEKTNHKFLKCLPSRWRQCRVFSSICRIVGRTVKTVGLFNDATSWRIVKTRLGTRKRQNTGCQARSAAQRFPE